MILDLVQKANEAVQEVTHGNTGTVTLPQENTGVGGPIFQDNAGAEEFWVRQLVNELISSGTGPKPMLFHTLPVSYPKERNNSLQRGGRGGNLLT